MILIPGYANKIYLKQINNNMQNKRLANFEVLRCTLMLMIVFVHFFGHGEKYAQLNSNFCFHLNSIWGVINFTISQIVATIAATAVNLFVFITGYFMIECHSLSVHKIAKLWIPVAFYSVAMATVSFRGGNIGWHDLLKSFLPIKGEEYWFVTNYFALILFAPFLAKLAAGLNSKSYQVGLAIMAFLMLELYKFPYGFTYKNGYGTSLLFFVMLFFVGGYFRKYGNLLPLKALGLENNRKFFLIVVCLVSIYGAVRGVSVENAKAVVCTTPYHSFTFLVSVALFQYFLNLNFCENWFTKLCCILAPYTFAVYLIHDNSYVRNWLWHDVIHLENTLNTPYYVLLVLFIPLAIYFCCITVEYLRVELFKVIGVNKLLQKIKYDVLIF